MVVKKRNSHLSIGEWVTVWRGAAALLDGRSFGARHYRHVADLVESQQAQILFWRTYAETGSVAHAIAMLTDQQRTILRTLLPGWGI